MTTDLVTTSSVPLPDRIAYAKALADSSLLPRAYQKQPANVLVASEMGASLGLAPIDAINSIHVIEGKPTVSADLMAALIRRAGHKLRVTTQSSPLSVTATLIRRDDPDFAFTVTWDMEKAKQAGLAGKGVWRQYPDQMLRSRAVTEVARQGASDVLHGVIYAPEELGVDVGQDGTPTAAPSVPAQAPAPAAQIMQQPDPDMVDKETLVRLWADVADYLPGTNKEARLVWISDEVGREIRRLSELTADDVEMLRTVLAPATATADTDDDVVDADLVDPTTGEVQA